MGNNANYVVRRSAWSVVKAWHILLFWLVIPLIIMICKIVAVKHQTIEFYDDYIITKSGVLSKNESRCAFSGIKGVSVSQSVWGRMFHYGNVKVDVVGRWDIDTTYVVNPQDFKKFLENHFAKTSSIEVA